MDENKSGLYIVAIVGIIAVVALVIMVTSAGVRQSTITMPTNSITQGDTATDATGQAMLALGTRYQACLNKCNYYTGPDISPQTSCRNSCTQTYDNALHSILLP